MLNFCITQDAIFVVLSQKGSDCTKVKFIPVRFGLIRGILRPFLLKRNCTTDGRKKKIQN